MAQTIKLKRTATPSNVPTTAQLELGEIAVNTYDGNVYIKKNDGADAIVKINANPSDLNYFVNGEGTVAGTWLGTDPDITSYYDGLVIWYRITINGASTTTLNINGLGAKTIYRYSTAKLTTHWPVNSVIPLVYVAALNGGSFIGGYDWSDGTQSYDLRWSSAVVNGTSIIHGYQLLMEGADTKFYPVTVGGVANSTTNTVQTAPLRIGGQMLYYNSATDIAVNAVIGGNLLYESIESGEGEYWMNRTSSSSWTAIGLPLYIVGTVNANNELILDNSTTTAFLTNALPTTEDGKIYIHVGYSDNEDDLWRLSVTHPIFEFKAGAIRRYTPALIPSEVLDAVKTVDGASSGLDADLLDGQHGSYYATAASVTAIAALDPVLTLTGDVTGSATFTNLGNATLTAVVADDSHNHVISNVDGLQAALDSKLNLTGGTISGTLTLDNGGSSTTSLVMKGTAPTISFLDDDTNADDFYIHVNSNRFYILANRTDAEVDLVGSGWETPHPMYLDSAANTGYLFDQRMFSDSYHPNADTWTTARTLGVTLTGDVTGSATMSVNGGSNQTATITTVVADDSHNHSNYLPISGKAADSELLDGIDSSSFLRSDAADTASGELLFGAGFKSDQVALSGAQNFDNLSRSGFYNLYNSDTGSTNSPGFPYGTLLVQGSNKGGNTFVTQTAYERTGAQYKIRGMNDSGATWYPWQTIWTSGTDGSGSGLDADLLDGQQGSYYAPASHNHSGVYLPIGGKAADSELLDGIDSSSFLRSDTADTFTGTLTMGTQQALVANAYGSGVFGLYSATRYQHVWSMGTAYKTSADGTSYGNMYGLTWTHTNIGTGANQSIAGLSHQLQLRENGVLKCAFGTGIWTAHNITSGGQGTLWGSSNDGAGSGLDADLLDGLQGSRYVANQDGSRYTTNFNTILTSGFYNAEATPANAPGSYGQLIVAKGVDTGMQIYGGYATDNLWFRGWASSGATFYSWRKAWHDGNDGSGSGLDADSVDGYDSLRLTKVTGGTVAGDWNTIFNTASAGTSAIYEVINIYGGSHSNQPSGLYSYGGVLAWRLDSHTFKLYSSHLGDLAFQSGWGNDGYSGWRNILHSANIGSYAWTSSNDGSGSGLDADLLDGQQGSYYAPASSIPSVGNGTITVTTSGSASGGGTFTANQSGNTTFNISATNTTYSAGTGISLSGTTFSLTDTNAKLNLSGGTATGTINAPTFNATSTTSGGFQGIDADTITAPSFTWTSDLNTGMWHAAADQIGFTTGGVNRVTITSTGITAVGDVTAYSDMRLKENIEVIPNAVSKVQQLRGVTFTRNDAEDLEQRHTGVIAQEVEAVLPEAVSEDNAGIKNVAYGNMVGLLIEAIKELKSEVDDLKQQLENK